MYPILRFAIQELVNRMSQLIKILKSSDYESKQRQIRRLKKEIDTLTNEVEMIESTMEPQAII